MNNELKLRAALGRTWLIQRLQLPVKIDNPFSFGGGLRNGGLSEEAMTLLRDIFSFDYMGSAEFEFGAVPAMLKFIAQQSRANNLIAAEMKCEDKPIWYVCPRPYQIDVEKRISELYRNEGLLRLKEHCGLREKLENSKWGQQNEGWLELDNGFAFFVNRTMFDRFCNLFFVPFFTQSTTTTHEP